MQLALAVCHRLHTPCTCSGIMLGISSCQAVAGASLTWKRCALQADQIRAAVTEYADYNVFTLDYPRPDEPTVHIGAYELEEQ